MNGWKKGLLALVATLALAGSAFAQGGGYILAALFPFIAGIVRQQFSDLTGAWIFMALASLVMFAIARRFSPDDCHLRPRHSPQ